ncbi:hypothetical protein [Paenibacillus sp. An7]|uniref:hypothetical protein n=1 Tax=Paenibacillus sp. An7 TaxID=2689577 RepID=UPI001357B731|nr:hypothetical protein [Paenibacillus sp. An7]
MGYNMNNRDPLVEGYISTLDNESREVFIFMRDQFEQLTDDGDNYDPEKHDEIISRLAGEKFGVSEEVSAKIYEDVSVGIHKVQMERQNK